MAHFIRQDFKSILNTQRFIDSWFWCRYSINTYNGCQFGCVYCDARSQKYHLPVNFENKIIIKNNIRSLLDTRLSKARTLRPDVVVLSGTTDPYQAAEKKYENTLQCLEVLLKHKYPVHICTKSSLILRDLEILNEIGRNSWCTVSVTITTPQKEKALFLEKLAPPPDDRFNVIKTIKEKTKFIQSGLLLIPTIPFITDNDHDLLKMIEKTKQSKADYLLFGGGMTLRDIQGTWFLNHLIKEYPELLKKYEELYSFKFDGSGYNGNYEIKGTYSKNINLNLLALCRENNIN